MGWLIEAFRPALTRMHEMQGDYSFSQLPSTPVLPGSADYRTLPPVLPSPVSSQPAASPNVLPAVPQSVPPSVQAPSQPQFPSVPPASTATLDAVINKGLDDHGAATTVAAPAPGPAPVSPSAVASGPSTAPASPGVSNPGFGQDNSTYAKGYSPDTTKNSNISNAQDSEDDFSTKSSNAGRKVLF